MYLPPGQGRKSDNDRSELARQAGDVTPGPGSEIADSDNPIVAVWHLRAQRRKSHRWRLWLVPATIAAGLLALPVIYSQYVSIPLNPRIQLVGALWAIALPLATGWLLFGLYDACLTALELLAQHRVRSGRAPADEMIGLTALSDFEILGAGLRLTLVPLIPRTLGAAAAIWAALTATNWVWGLDAYAQYGGSYWLRGELAETYFDSFYWEVVSRLLATAPLVILRCALNSLLACAFIILALICAGRHGPPAVLARGMSFSIVLAQPGWLLAGLCLFFTPAMPEGISLTLALVAPAVFAVTAALFWLALVSGSSPGCAHGVWAGQLTLAAAIALLLAMVFAYGYNPDTRYLVIVPANSIWGLSCMAALNPFSLPPEAYTWLLENSYYNYGFGPEQNSPYLLGCIPWLLLTAGQLGLTAIGLAFARESVARWRHGAD